MVRNLENQCLCEKIFSSSEDKDILQVSQLFSLEVVDA